MNCRRNLIALSLLVAFVGRVASQTNDGSGYVIKEMEERFRLGLYTDPAYFDDEDESEGSGSGEPPLGENSTSEGNIRPPFDLTAFLNLTLGLNDVIREEVTSFHQDILPAIDQFQAKLENATMRLATTLQCRFANRIQESVRIMEKIYALTGDEIDVIKAHLVNSTDVQTSQPPISPQEGNQTAIELPEPGIDSPRDCEESYGSEDTGVLTIRPDPSKESYKSVWCDQHTDFGGWTVILRRQPQPVQLDFQRDWETYEEGFGDPYSSYWIGLKTLHDLTKDRPHHLRIEMEAGEESAVALYDTFSVGPSWRQYSLQVGDYQVSSTAGDALEYHNGRRFTTYDNDNDGASGGNCANWSGGGGWWYDFCFLTNPTGLYPSENNSAQSDMYMEWRQWQGHYNYLSRFVMMIKPIIEEDAY